MPNCDAGLVSVLMSVYNGAPTLEKAAASVLAQTYRDLELILCDDASTDDTWRIMQRIAAQDARVTIFQNKTNLGLGASLNECLARAQGAYIARQDADDVSDSDRIERTMDFLLSSGAPYAACGVRVFDDTGVWSTRQFPQKITKHIIAQKNPFFHPTMLFRRAVLKSVNGYSTSPETRRTEDYDLVMRLAANGVIGKTCRRFFTRCTNRRKPISVTMPGPACMRFASARADCARWAPRLRITSILSNRSSWRAFRAA